MAAAAAILLLCISFVIKPPRLASASSLFCHPQSLAFHALNSQCHLSVTPSAPLEVDGDSLERALSFQQSKNAYITVLFYARWCPFSRATRSTFDALSSMFPHISHLAVEESSALPSIFSRYGVHSVPSIIIAKGAFRVRHHGPKDLNSLVRFCKKVTGLEPVYYFAKDQDASLKRESCLWLWNGSPREIFRREPYLVLASLFLFFRSFLYIFPTVSSQVKAFLVLHVWCPNLGIFGEKSQLLEHALHVIDIKRIWSKLKLCKAGNFHKGAKNARAWASLASVSLGESSLFSRPAAGTDS